MGLFRGRRLLRRDTWGADPLPPTNYLVRTVGLVGETFWPALGVIDWREYLETRNERHRYRAVKETRRQLQLTDVRLLVWGPARAWRADISLLSILDISLRPPAGGGWQADEVVIRAEYGYEGKRMESFWGSKRPDADAFVDKLTQLRDRPFSSN